VGPIWSTLIRVDYCHPKLSDHNGSITEPACLIGPWVQLVQFGYSERSETAASEGKGVFVPTRDEDEATNNKDNNTTTTTTTIAPT
jgi:hypothetical protein